MATISEIISQLSEVAAHPEAELNRHLAADKKVIGVGPYYVPEELVYAAGAIPFGVWGRMGTATEARKYFPPFYCSICQMTLEMGLNHELDKLSGFMTAALCDTQRGFSQNFRVGVTQVPMIFVSQPQNRATKAGFDYAVSSYRELKTQVGEACDAIIEDGDPIEGLALGYCELKNDSILYDAEKSHISHVVDIAKESGAQGVVLLLAKFCDPEEFDAPLLAKECRNAGLPIVQIEVDQSAESYEQARTQLETFKELLGA